MGLFSREKKIISEGVSIITSVGRASNHFNMSNGLDMLLRWSQEHDNGREPYLYQSYDITGSKFQLTQLAIEEIVYNAVRFWPHKDIADKIKNSVNRGLIAEELMIRSALK